MTTRTFSDFMSNATPEEKRALFLEVAREANEEQRKIIREALCTDCHCRFAPKVEPNYCECNCHRK